ncbi:gamma-glutamyltransferase, partial [Pseudoalteromonas sp. 24-MNA-CIBAN-0067]
PSSGGVAVLQILGLLEHKDMANIKANSAEAIHYFSQASRIAFADRNKYIGDPDFTQVPTEELLNKDYIATRAKLITEKDQKAFPGDPVDYLS